MLRRIHLSNLRVGRLTLDPAAAHHARDVLRLEAGTEVELFDDAGNLARAPIVALTPDVVVQIDEVTAADAGSGIALTIGAAVPKGERADWMIEKLSELGVSRFIPLAAARSVVLPEGKNKRDRWIRIATEAAKQSRRRGVMQIDELTQVAGLLAAPREGFVLSTAPDAKPVTEAFSHTSTEALLLIGPEGGWTDVELAAFTRAGLTSVKLTDTILRVETAAIAAAAVVMSLAASQASNPRRSP